MHAEHYGFSVEPVTGASNASHTIVATPHGQKKMQQQQAEVIATVNDKLAVIGEFIQDQLAQVKNMKESMGVEKVEVDLEKWLENLVEQVKGQAKNSTTGGKSKDAQ